ncbi:DUF262 domain-containing protein [Bacteroides acidifaciens]|uniref:DUF262 domain-containing protein n=1 Tax=Bacteroides acidifaciens TaxID=85831 RepID=UPI0030154DFA
MAYQTALTIANVVKDIDTKRYLLPSIQREFVWSAMQIERLFDSLMQEYPINGFLFWKVPKEKVSEFKFYEFLRNYHQRNMTHNVKANLSGSDDVIAILDGQQRMTSLYIGLKGTYAYKMSYKRWDNPAAYPERKLYLNLLEPSEETDQKYDFRFLTEKEAQVRDDSHYWFLVGKILDIKQPYEVNNYLVSNDLAFVKNPEDKERVMFANQTLSQLYYAVHVNGTISYYLEESTELDKVLNIFIRVNSGGTTLSYSDLLLSFATAQWEKRDAREEINKFMDEVNQIGRGFNIGKDIILKSCLVLSDAKDISFKVDNFNRTNMLVIEKKWDNLTAALRMAVELVASFGFSRDNITSNNLFIPIAYYIKSIGVPENFIDSSKYADDRKAIKRWFVASLLKSIFSFSPDAVLKPIRDIIDGNPGRFPLEEIIKRFKNTNRDITFSDENIENLLFTKYGSGDVLIVLSILYPWANLRNSFHIDHIYPRSKFTAKKLGKRGYDQDTINFYMDNFNYLGNLQLLEEIPNKEKNDREFEEWMDSNYSNQSKRKDYMEKHYIPDVSFSFDNFEDFFTEREQLLVAALRKELA